MQKRAVAGWCLQRRKDAVTMETRGSSLACLLFFECNTLDFVLRRDAREEEDDLLPCVCFSTTTSSIVCASQVGLRLSASVCKDSKSVRLG